MDDEENRHDHETRPPVTAPGAKSNRVMVHVSGGREIPVADVPLDEGPTGLNAVIRHWNALAAGPDQMIAITDQPKFNPYGAPSWWYVRSRAIVGISVAIVQG